MKVINKFPPLHKLCALLLLCLAVFILISLALAAPGITVPKGLATLGKTLLDRFSWASLFIPTWLFCAAIISYLPGWKPRTMIALSGSIVVFIPIAVFARIASIQEYSLLFGSMGIAGLAIAAIILALIFGFLVVRIILRYPKSTSHLLMLPAPAGSSLQNSYRYKSPISQAPEKAEKSYTFQVPDLQPLPSLKVMDKTESPVSTMVFEMPDAGGNWESEEAISISVQTTNEGGQSSLFMPMQDDVPDAECEVILGDEEVAAEEDTPQITSDEIEFISVPPPSSAGKLSENTEAKKKNIAKKRNRNYSVPVEGILNVYPDGEYWIIDEKTKRMADVLTQTLAEFKIEAKVTGIRKGPVITMYEILPAHGIKLSKICNLSDNIALRLAASSVRIVAPIPGKHAVGIEVPNEARSIVSLREIVDQEKFRTSKMEIPIILGKDIGGEAQFIDLTQTPHLLIAGSTGSGKSVCVNSIILSILYRCSPDSVRLMLIDPKIVELKLYNDIPHLLTPVITESKKAFQALQYCICEMERRYTLLDKAGARNIKNYNRKIKDKDTDSEVLPYIVVIIDEFADLMATTGKELESTLARLAAMSRAVGIHLVLATQRPSINVITGLIKANIPSRIAFMVASTFDSRIIIDMVGAEKLLGKGDMLVATAWDPFPVRMQGSFVSEEEVENAVEYIKTLGSPEYIDEEIFIEDEEEDLATSVYSEDADPLFEKALQIVMQQGKASASYIQRKLKIGYNRAARLVELMEEKGIVGPAQGSKPRELVRNPAT